MEKRFFHLAIVALITGILVYANRKKIKSVMSRRVTKIGDESGDFIRSIRKYV